MRFTLHRAKAGFNLIEIAIVLAVIGLVIGGIYVAAAAVTENNRQQAHQKQILQLVQNLRATYASQPTFIAPGYAQLKAMGVVPADITDTGTGFANPWGGAVKIANTPTTTYSVPADQIILIQTVLPPAACAKLLSNFLGSGKANQQMGLVEAGTSAGHSAGPSAGTGVTVASAASVCGIDGVNNSVDLYFSLR